MQLSEGWLPRIKAAQRDLIEACGTYRRIESRSNYSKTVVGRWSNTLDPTLMPLEAIIALEADCGVPYVTQVMAELSGRRLTDPETENLAESCVMSSNADVMRQLGELQNSLALAIGDGSITPAEAHAVDRFAASLQNATSDLRTALAVIKAKGGAAAGLRVVGIE